VESLNVVIKKFGDQQDRTCEKWSITHSQTWKRHFAYNKTKAG